MGERRLAQLRLIGFGMRERGQVAPQRIPVQKLDPAQVPDNPMLILAGRHQTIERPERGKGKAAPVGCTGRATRYGNCAKKAPVVRRGLGCNCWTVPAMIKRIINGLAMLDIVALLADLPVKGLVRGQVGTVIESVDATTSLVEFCDELGKAHAASRPVADRNSLGSSITPHRCGGLNHPSVH